MFHFASQKQKQVEWLDCDLVLLSTGIYPSIWIEHCWPGWCKVDSCFLNVQIIPQAYSLMVDFMTLGKWSSSIYSRLRCFDLYKLHSWAGGLTKFAEGRNQKSTNEAVNAYYSAALMGLFGHYCHWTWLYYNWDEVE